MTGALFVDLKKGFDTVPPDGLLLKLYRFGIQHNVMTWFESYLKGRVQVVCIHNQLSGTITVESGVPQGSILGALLFTMYTNDLPTYVQFLIVSMCSNDTVDTFFVIYDIRD